MIKITDLPFKTNALNVFKREGIEYLEDVTKYPMIQIANFKGFGLKSIKTLYEQLDRFNLKTKDEQ